MEKIFYFGKWQKSYSNKIFTRSSFYDKKKYIYSDCNSKDLNKVIVSASKGLVSNRNKKIQDRSDYLKKISKIIFENRYELANYESSETGKKYQSSLNEISYSSKLWLSASKIIRSGLNYKLNNEKKVNSYIVHEPVGIVGLIIPWNFPFLVLSERLPFILAAGNSVIIKPSQYASQSIINFIKMINKIKLSNGIINLITGGNKIGSSIVQHGQVNMISFTGSTNVGKKIMKDCSKSIKRLSLELGGKNSMIILKDAEISKSIDILISSFTANSGQACVGISKLFIPTSKKKVFLKKLISFLKNTNFKSIYGPISINKQYEKIKKMTIKNNKYKKFIIYKDFTKNIKSFFNPIVYLNLPIDSNINTEEIFGPVLSIYEFKNYEQAIFLANKTNYGLSSVIVSKNLKKASKIAKQLNVGRIWINQSITKNYANIPIGGFKESGFGRECGIEGIKNYSELKTIIINEK